LGERPLTIRTLDIGGDKPVPYLPFPDEENPALGLRGIRTSLLQPDLLDAQLRAIARVRSKGRLRVMLPMIASLSELRAVRRRWDEIHQGSAVELGVMIETPSAAMTADRLAEEADFFSIGSNDLTQYVLAMDRGSPMLAAQADALHPAVLRMIAVTVEGAAKHQRPAAVCGGLASDPAGAVILAGLGIRELSGVPAAFAAIRSALAKLTLTECRELAARALSADSPADVRSIVSSALDSAGERS
jgi:phosphoenolpyruvate-protein kinase (PTS system EI component)